MLRRAFRSAPSRRLLAWPAHFYSTLRRLQEPQAGSSSDGRPAIYVTGFMTDTAEAGNWDEWLTSHKRLSKELNWCDDAYGLDWRSGAGGDILGKWPFPLHTPKNSLDWGFPQTLLYLSSYASGRSGRRGRPLFLRELCGYRLGPDETAQNRLHNVGAGARSAA